MPQEMSLLLWTGIWRSMKDGKLQRESLTKRTNKATNEKFLFEHKTVNVHAIICNTNFKARKEKKCYMGKKNFQC